MTIAYQGIKGAYSYIASKFLFPEESLVGKKDFESVFEMLSSGEADSLVLPIENTVIGSIFEVYDLLFQHEEIRITGEVSLKVDHTLLGIQKDTNQIQEVYSHPKALAQCAGYIKNLTNVTPKVWEDTAAAAAYVSLKQDPSSAAIASATAAKEYGLEVIATKIQDNPLNQTRFVVIQKIDGENYLQNQQTESVDSNAIFKTSLEFVASHEPGSLLDCLQPFAKAKLNLTKIESRPLLGSPFQYLFYLDFEHLKLNGELEEILEEIKPHTQVLRDLGTYPKGVTIGELVDEEGNVSIVVD